MKYLVRFLVVISLLASSVGIAGQAHADSLGFAISPPSLEISANPGQSVTGSFKIINLTGSPLVLAADRNNFVAKGEEGQVDLTTNNDLYSLAPWFSATPDVINVPAKGTQSVSFKIDIPLNAEPGGRYGSLVFHTLETTLPSGQSGAAVKQQLGALIFLRIAGNANERVEIASFKTEKAFYEIGPIKFETRIKDTGNVHAKPTGTITVKNLLGMKVATVKLEPKNVIPGAIRRTETTLNKKWMFGFYKATLVLNNGDKQQLTAETSFTVVPYKLLIIAASLLVVLYFLLWRNRKRFKKAFRALSGKD